ncbi:MAG: transglycosylase domain-containing protein [Treponema sp.]|nr:transglycosylase domain-containing protein [Treponema sp.]
MNQKSLVEATDTLLKSNKLKTKKAICLFSLCSLLLAFLAALWLLLRLTPYPQLDKILQQQYSSRIYDRDGQLLQVTSLKDGFRREFTSLPQIPAPVKKSFLLSEDKRFYFHNGVDVLAASMAFFQNASSKKIVRGASTITMQLVKICQQEENSEYITSPWRKKFYDIINAWRIEARLSKKQILELYLNNLPFGMNTFGVTSAARSFFGKELSQLTKEEICCLAVIPRRPVAYNPIQNPENCSEKAFILGKKQYRHQNLTYQTFLDTAKNAQKYAYPFKTPHYISYLEKQVYKNNLPPEINLPLSLNLQEKGEQFLGQALQQASNSRIANAALLIVDNRDGSVLAWVGNPNWFDYEHNGQIDGVLVKNQPGSSMKPFLYALALDSKDENNQFQFYPSKIMADIPKEFGQEKIYIPANFNNRFNGPVRFRIALASSLNVPAVDLLNTLGVDEYLTKLLQLGFDSLQITGKKADLGLALGAGEVTLYELVNAFSVFPRDGLDFNQNQIYSKDSARIICSILSDKSARALGFGFSQSFETSYPAIFKTGTSNQYQNIVALGATKNYTVGVWMGNHSGQTVVGKTGSSLPAWVAKNMLDILEGKNALSKELTFPAPEDWHLQKICSLSGMAASEHCTATIYDFIPKDFLLEKCDWHQKIEDSQTNVVYPAEYQQWIRESKTASEVDFSEKRFKSSPMQLLTPKDNAIFYLSNNLAQKQAIPVEITGGAEKTITVKYDDLPELTFERPFYFSLPVEQGKHNCLVINGDEELNFCFTVK